MNDATYKELTSYTDHELAFFVRYRLPHLDGTMQQEMLAYVSGSRKLSDIDINFLVAGKIPRDQSGKPRCSRCGTTRLKVRKHRRSCLVCSRTTSRNEWVQIIGFIAELLLSFAG